MSETDNVFSIPTRSLKLTIGIFALTGLGLGLTGAVVLFQLGSGGGLFGGVLLLLLVTTAFLFSPVIGVISGLRVGSDRSRTPDLYTESFLTTMLGSYAMMGTVLITIGLGMAVMTGGGAGGSGSVQTGASGVVGSSGDLNLQQYILPIILVGIPTGVTGVGGAYFGARTEGSPEDESIKLPVKGVATGLVIISVLLISVPVVSVVLAPPAPQLSVDGDVYAMSNVVIAGGTVENPTGQAITNDVKAEFVVGDDVVGSNEDTVTVGANGELSVGIELMNLDDLTTSQTQSLQSGDWEVRYIINQETVEVV